MTPCRGMLSLVVLIAVCVCLATFIGWLDFHANEVQPAVLLILVCTAVLSFIVPERAWLIALLIGASIFVTHVVAATLGIPQSAPPNSTAGTMVALIPATIGAVCGAGARLLSRPARRVRS